MNEGKFRLSPVPEIGEPAPIETDAATAPPDAPVSAFPAVYQAEQPDQPQEAALIAIHPEIQPEAITAELKPAVQQIVDAIKTGYKKLKSDYWAGVLSGAVIVLTVHYMLKESKEK